jgi:hypothetical protein
MTLRVVVGVAIDTNCIDAVDERDVLDYII